MMSVAVMAPIAARPRPVAEAAAADVAACRESGTCCVADPGRPAALAGQTATVAEATAAAATVELATAIVSREGFPCFWGVRDKMFPLSGVRGHARPSPRTRAALQRRRPAVARGRDAGQGDGSRRSNRHARGVPSDPTLPNQ
jgi:hypothetical protein